MKRRNRKKIITGAAICYLTGMAGLTFCSNWISRRILPEVTVQYADGGYINQNYYDIVLDQGAVRYGIYVFLIETRDSPIGERYFARYVPVTVLDYEEGRAAVEGALAVGDRVIVQTDAEVGAGQQVWIKE